MWHFLLRMRRSVLCGSNHDKSQPPRESSSDASYAAVCLKLTRSNLATSNFATLKLDTLTFDTQSQSCRQEVCEPYWQSAAELAQRLLLSESGDLASAVAAVQRFSPGDRVQAQHRRRLLDFAARHPDALHRSCETGHLTASAWVVNHDATCGLVLLHAKIGRWLQPGGHADGEPLLWRVALREATEETGIRGLEIWTEPIDVDVHLFVNRREAEPSHLHFDVRYVVRCPPGASPIGNHESDAMRWITPAQLADSDLGLDASARRLARYGFDVVRNLPTPAASRRRRPAV